MYVDTSKQVGDLGHLRVFANAEAARGQFLFRGQQLSAFCGSIDREFQRPFKMREGSPRGQLRPFLGRGVAAGECDAGQPTYRLRVPYRPRRRFTFLRLVPTFLTAFFTAAADFLVFFASYRTS